MTLHFDGVDMRLQKGELHDRRAQKRSSLFDDNGIADHVVRIRQLSAAEYADGS